MEHKAEAMTKFFQEQIARCEADRQALLRDDRGDEATFQRIRGNIFDIFRTVLSVAVQNCTGDEAIGAFFSLRLEQIPGSWLRSLEAARERGDTETVCLEQLKLETVEQIRDAFRSIWEVAQ